MISVREFARVIMLTAATLLMGAAVYAQDKEIKLGEGEILYKAITKLEKCDEATISFVLSANKDTLKNFMFEFNGIYIKGSTGGLKKVTSKNTYNAKVAVSDGAVDYTYPWHSANWQITIKEGLGEETVQAEIKCVYVVSYSPSQVEELGTATVEFKKAEPEQE